MITIFSFLTFYFVLNLIGRGVSRFLGVSNHNYFDIPVILFNPILGLFYIGNMTVILNFFFPINSYFQIIILFTPLLFGISNLKLNINFKRYLNIKTTLIYFLTPFILGISSLNTNLAYDAGLYHLNHQNWIKSSKIVFGLSNIHMRFGYSSIIEYINVNFWLEDNFLLLHFVNLIFIVFFFQVIVTLLFTKYYKFSISILIYGFLDNFGFNGGKNGFVEIEAVSKQDTPFAVLFFISTYFLYRYLISKEKDIDTKLLFYIILFTTQMRILGAVCLIAFILIYLNNNNFFKTLKYFLTTGAIGSLFGLLFLIKNIITSSCTYFPFDLLCFSSFPWSSKSSYASASVESGVLGAFHVAMNTENYTEWFTKWLSKEVNSVVSKNLFLTICIIIIYLFINQKINKNRRAPYLFTCTLYVMLSFLIWIFTAPGIRMGIGLFISLIFLISNIYESEKSINLKNNFGKTILIFYIIVIALVPQVNNYLELVKTPLNLDLVVIESETIDYVDNELGYGVLPSSGDQCWINLECVRNENVKKENFYSYVIFKD